MNKYRIWGRVQAALYIYQQTIKRNKQLLPYLFQFILGGSSSVLSFCYKHYFLIHYSDGWHFRYTFDEIFKQQCYFIQLETESPFIIDLGANIGLSVCYFKSLYPKAKIIAFEPNPIAFKLLHENLKYNKIKNVKMFPKAVIPARNHAKSEFYLSPISVVSTISKQFKDERFKYKKIFVNTISLSKILKPIHLCDLLKIDIEGSEYFLINEIIKNRSKIKKMIIEFHMTNEPNFYIALEKLSKYFRISFHKQETNPLVTAFFINSSLAKD